MKCLRQIFLTGFLLLIAATLPLPASDDYVPGPDSQAQTGVPQGKLFSFTFAGSKIYPGTVRTVWVYIPAQYTPEKPACLFLSQDGISWNATVVFDNLIAKGEMPVTIGVFVSPGIVGVDPAATEVSAAKYAAMIAPRGTTDARAASLPSLDVVTGLEMGQRNRVYEYSEMNDRYVRFLLDELLPAVAARPTPDGQPIRFSAAGHDRAIAGSSAGAICAFNAAWWRPDAFSRVFTVVGSFNLGGGEVWPILIRKFEPKPLRIFLQDGSHDTGVFAGNWWMANQAVEESLRFAGYEVNHAFGDGGHTSKHPTAIFPDAMRWLWKDWPRPIQNSGTQNEPLRLVLRAGQTWQPVGGDFQSVRATAVNERGEVFFGDAGANRIYRVGLDGKVAVFSEDLRQASDFCFGPDGRLYAVSRESGKVEAYAADGGSSVIADGLEGDKLTVANNGNIYVTHSVSGEKRSELWLIRPDGTKQVVERNAAWGASGLALSPTQKLLFVADHQRPSIHRYLIRSDGSLEHGQRYIQLARTEEDLPPDTAGIRTDRHGRLWVATGLGIQMCAEAALLNAILPTPHRPPTDLCFGGANFDTLYALCDNQVFRRELNVRGVNGWEAPSKPEPLKASRVPR